MADNDLVEDPTWNQSHLDILAKIEFRDCSVCSQPAQQGIREVVLEAESGFAICFDCLDRASEILRNSEALPNSYQSVIINPSWHCHVCATREDPKLTLEHPHANQIAICIKCLKAIIDLVKHRGLYEKTQIRLLSMPPEQKTSAARTFFDPPTPHIQAPHAWGSTSFPICRVYGGPISAQTGENEDTSQEPQLKPEKPETELNAPSRAALTGHDIQPNQPVEIGEPERHSTITDRQTLNPTLINTVLDAMNIDYHQDEERNYQLFLPNDTVMIGLSLPDPSEIRIACIYNTPIPDTKWMKALLACNDFHQTSKLGRAYFIPKNEKEAMFVYELRQGFEGGMVSEEYLIRTLLQAIEHAGRLFTMIEQECGS